MDERSVARYVRGDLGGSRAFSHVRPLAACNIHRSADAREILGDTRAAQKTCKIKYVTNVKKIMPPLPRGARIGARCAELPTRIFIRKDARKTGGIALMWMAPR